MKRKPYRIKRKKSIWKTKLFWRFFIGLLFLGEVLYSIYFLIPFQIKEIKISGNEKVKTEDIDRIIEKGINKKVLFFQTKSIFLVNPPVIKKSVLTNFPQIGKIDLKRKFFNGLIAEIEERKPVAVFKHDSESFLMDKEGIIFEINNEAMPELIAIKNDVSSLTLGQRAVEEKLMSYILEIEDKLKNELMIPIKEVLIVSNERIDVKTSQGWGIYFSLKNEISWQLTKLKAVLEKEIPKNQQKNLAYIDVRFGNLAPYKYR